MRIRQATHEDASQLSRLSERTFTQTFGHLYPPDDLDEFLRSAYAVEEWESLLLEPHHATWLLMDSSADETVCGYALAGPCTLPHPEVADGDMEIKRLYILQEFQGSGSGTALFETSLTWAEAQTSGDLWLGVWSENYRAQKLYERYGFTKVGEYQFKVGLSRDREFIFRRSAPGA